MNLISLLLFYLFLHLASASIWTDVVKSQTQPRVAHTTIKYMNTATNDTKLIVFGGSRAVNDTIYLKDNLFGALNSVQSFSTISKSWTTLSNNTDFLTNTSSPFPRALHASAVVHADSPFYANCMFVYGGELHGNGDRPFMMAFNLSNNQWIMTDNDTWRYDPMWGKGNRRSAAFHYCKLDHSLVLFGGGGDGVFSDTHKFYLKNESWVQIANTGNIPDPVSRMASAVSPDGKFMYIYGGALSTGIYTQFATRKSMWRLDLINHSWYRMPDNLNRFPLTPQGALLFAVNSNTLWLLPYIAEGYSDIAVSKRASAKWHAYQYKIDSGAWLDDPIPEENAPPWSLWYDGTLLEDSSGIHAIINGGGVYPNGTFVPETSVRYLTFVDVPFVDSSTTSSDNVKNQKNDHLIAIIIPAIVVPLAAIVIVVGIIIILKRRSQSRSELFQMEMNMEDGKSNNMKDLSASAITDIKIQSRIGGGNFGDVYVGMWQGSTPVACKMLKNQEQLRDFEQEANILKQLRHPNVVQFLGIYTESTGGTQYIVMEYMPQGSLSTFLKVTPNITIEQRLNMCKDAAAGMLYISEVHHLVHRDLALRNLLIVNKEGQYVVKISDLGLTREINTEGHYAANDSPIPIKWSAPEAIRYRKYNDKSDIWSFGITMWEILSYGQEPYQGTSNEHVLEKIMSGYRLPSPSADTPSAINQLLLQCWSENPEERPSFKTIHNIINSSIE